MWPLKVSIPNNYPRKHEMVMLPPQARSLLVDWDASPSGSSKASEGQAGYSILDVRTKFLEPPMLVPECRLNVDRAEVR